MGGHHDGENEGALTVDVKVQYSFVTPAGKEYKLHATHKMIPTPNGAGPVSVLDDMEDALQDGNARCMLALARLIMLAEKGNWMEDPYVMALEELNGTD